MSVTLDATVAGATANSYLTVDEGDDYYSTRVNGVIFDAWDNADSKDALLMMATRTLDAMVAPYRLYVPRSGSQEAYFYVRPTWIGKATTTTQRLAWPRTGMLDQNGNAIDSMVIPQALKDAVAELAGQLANDDRTLDNDALVKGITSIKAGSVGLSFKDSSYVTKVLPDAVAFILVPSWLTDGVVEPAMAAEFEVL